jgi:predicted aldo/keto reductase-like oxidoreductase
MARPTLPTRRLGRSGLVVTIVGFGGIPIQIVSEEQAIATVRRAWDLGVTFFDTARGYSNSEERIGKALAGRQFTVASKAGNGDAAGAYEAVCTSLQQLNLPKVHLYQLHGVNDDEDLARRTAPGGALDGLRRARDEGKIDHIGITGHRAETLMRAVEEQDEFVSVQVPFNVVESELTGTLLPLCARKNVGVIAMKPVGGGNFTQAALAVKWCINQPITVAIPGMASVQEVEEDVGVAAGGGVLTPEEVAACERMKSELDQRTCRRCRYCEPCPNGVQIGTMFHGRSIIKRMGVARFVQWGGVEAIASVENCVECGQCIEKCPYDLPIPTLLREHVEIYRQYPELAKK